MSLFERKKEERRPVELEAHVSPETEPAVAIEALYTDLEGEHDAKTDLVDTTERSLKEKAAAIEPVDAEQTKKLEEVKARIASAAAEVQKRIQELLQVAVFSVLMGSAPMAEAAQANPEAQRELITEVLQKNPEILENFFAGKQIVAQEVATKDPENKEAAESAIQSGELFVEIQERKTVWEKISGNPEVQDLVSKAVKCAFDAAQLSLVYNGFELLKSGVKAAHSFFQKLAARS